MIVLKRIMRVGFRLVGIWVVDACFAFGKVVVIDFVR